MKNETFKHEPTKKQINEMTALLLEIDNCIKSGDELGMKINLGMMQGYLIGSELLPVNSQVHLGEPEGYKWIINQIAFYSKKPTPTHKE
jgi:hypothetical protein